MSLPKYHVQGDNLWHKYFSLFTNLKSLLHVGIVPICPREEHAKVYLARGFLMVNYLYTVVDPQSCYPFEGGLS